MMHANICITRDVFENEDTRGYFSEMQRPIFLLHNATEIIQTVHRRGFHPNHSPALLVKKRVTDIEDRCSVGAIAAPSPSVLQQVRLGVVVLAGNTNPGSSRVDGASGGCGDHQAWKTSTCINTFVAS